MIEVEKKFKLTEEAKALLIKNAQFLGEKSFTDVYYDVDSWEFSKKDVWLRERDGEFELKAVLQDQDLKLADQYEEFTDGATIRHRLRIKDTGDLRVDIAAAGFNPFAKFTTTRRKYKQGEFVIDIDDVDYGDFSYAVSEIEMHVNDRSEIPEAINRILKFAQSYGLESIPVRGKLVEYMIRKRPEHLKALVESGAIRVV